MISSNRGQIVRWPRFYCPSQLVRSSGIRSEAEGYIIRWVDNQQIELVGTTESRCSVLHFRSHHPAARSNYFKSLWARIHKEHVQRGSWPFVTRSAGRIRWMPVEGWKQFLSIDKQLHRSSFVVWIQISQFRSGIEGIIFYSSRFLSIQWPYGQAVCTSQPS